MFVMNMFCVHCVHVESFLCVATLQPDTKQQRRCHGEEGRLDEFSEIVKR